MSFIDVIYYSHSLMSFIYLTLTLVFVSYLIVDFQRPSTCIGSIYKTRHPIIWNYTFMPLIVIIKYSFIVFLFITVLFLYRLKPRFFAAANSITKRFFGSPQYFFGQHLFTIKRFSQDILFTHPIPRMKPNIRWYRQVSFHKMLV